MKGNRQAGNRQVGFSLIEMMVVLLVLGIVSAGLFVQINNAQQRAFTEQVKLDNFQEARDFVDQFFRDINEIGYPNSRMVDTTSLLWSPALTTQTTYSWANAYINDNRVAMGLVKIDANEIQFEGDMNGNGVVQVWHNVPGTDPPTASYTGNVGYTAGQCVDINGSASQGCQNATPAPAPTAASVMTTYIGPYRPSDPNEAKMLFANIKFAYSEASADPTQP